MSKRINFKTVALFSMTVVTAVSSNILPTVSHPNINSAAATDRTVAQSRPEVVATSSVICGLTQEIAGNTVDLKCLVSPGSDPHVYQAKPDDRRAIDRAKLILYSGYDFEPSLIKLIQATSNKAPKVAVAEQAVPNPLMAEDEGHSHGGHSHGKDGKVPDPHVWHDAKNGIAMAKVISNHLAKVAPNQAAVYNRNTQKLTGEPTRLDNWIGAQIATIPTRQRKLVTTHDALGYYSKAYRIPVVGALEGISTDENPTAGRIASLVRDIRAAGVPTIFAEVTVNPKLIETVAREAKVKVSPRKLHADGLGEAGSEADTYQKMMVANTRTIVEGLGGRYAAFGP
ncbi:MAG: zinc ABC transporter substrate-binding protein [Oscillatoriaceae cyanobacterium Prado104]|jgi:manganese/iron transport system substrate-binding protein|nr:zinc ABC transporter substrate-binding protein [Oscillatoriaceae cyanobacterium Prado104]